LIDVNPERRAVATTLGVSFAAPGQAAEQADVVVHASGSAAGLDLARRLAAFETRIVEISWYGPDTVSIALGNAFHSKRLSLISSQVGRVAASQRARWDPRRRMELALSMLTEPALDALITGERFRSTAERDDAAGRCARRYDLPSYSVFVRLKADTTTVRSVRLQPD
jgi:threonine dehydrogenase-like Zn-dependent dehydrogenase